MSIKKFKKLLLIVICFVGLFACEKDLETKELADEGKLTEASGDRHLIEAAGYDISNLTFNEKEDKYIAEGDIVISRAHLDSWKKQAKGTGQKITNTYSKDGFVDQEKVKNIVVAPSWPFNRPDKIWLDALKVAIEKWNAVPECKIHLIYSDYGDGLSPDVIVSARDKNVWCGDNPNCTGPTADGEFPLNGLPGRKIRINRDSPIYDLLDIECKERVLAHELGHVLGFGHLYKLNAKDPHNFDNYRYLVWPYMPLPNETETALMYGGNVNVTECRRDRNLKYVDYRMAQIAYPRDGMFFTMHPKHSHSRFAPLYSYWFNVAQHLEKDFSKHQYGHGMSIMGYASQFQQTDNNNNNNAPFYNGIFKYQKGIITKYSTDLVDEQLMDDGFQRIEGVGWLEKEDFPQFPMKPVYRFTHKINGNDRLSTSSLTDNNWEFQEIMGYIYTP